MTTQTSQNCINPKPQARVQEYLKKTGLKPYQFAGITGLPSSSLYKWLNEEGDISLSQWLKICKLLERAE